MAAYGDDGDDGDDLLLARGRQHPRGQDGTVFVTIEDETVEAVFAQARDDDWKQAVVKPEAAPVNGNGNAHHADGVGPSVELVLGNGHASEPEEGQQSLFSRAEFMAEEPMKPSRNAKRRPSSLSLFEWAFSLKQEEELVSAQR